MIPTPPVVKPFDAAILTRELTETLVVAIDDELLREDRPVLVAHRVCVKRVRIRRLQKLFEVAAIYVAVD